jgi:fructose-1,6-bisphosphatase I
MDDRVTLKDHLKKQGCEEALAELILQFEDVCGEIYMQLETSMVQYVQSSNSSGDEQLNLDLIADEILVKYLDKSDLVSCYCSEERPSETCFSKKAREHYVVAYDPLDGSSVVEAGLAVGTVIGIYKPGTNLIGATGRDQVAALYVLYGSPIKIVYTVCKGVHVFSRSPEGKMILEEENVQLKNKGDICAIGGFQNIFDIPGYHDALHYWIENHYKLRYSGSMTADLHNILKKRGGIYTYPRSKLRLLYECNPLGLIFEEAGGIATDGKMNVLDIPIASFEHKLPILIGSQEDVATTQKFLTTDSTD